MQARELYPRRLAVALVLAPVLMLAACGGGDKDKKAIEKRVTTFDTAMAAKDASGVCASISRELKRQLTKTPSGRTGAPSCEVALRSNFILSGNVFANLAKAKVGDVQVDGDRGQATITYRGRKDRLGVAKQNGDWVITTLRLRP